MTLTEMIEALSTGKATSVEIVSDCLLRIKKHNPEINAFIELYEEEALTMASASDRRRAFGTALSPLDGIPFACKDSFLYKNHSCTCASRILSGFVSPYSATVIDRLIQGGAIPLGRTNMDEFAMGTRCIHSIYGSTHNPKFPELTSGGSSGGSAAAVSAGFVPFALGSDTGGSTRLPASYCGITGFKPARGCLSRYGLVAFSSSFDSVGLLCEQPADCFPLMECMQGTDGRDSTLRNDLWQESEDIHSVLLWDGTYPEGIESWLCSMGITVVHAASPDLDIALAAYQIISSAEATSNLARYDGLRYGLSIREKNLHDSIQRTRGEGFGEEVKRRLVTGIYALTHDELFAKAMCFRNQFANELIASLPDGTALLISASPYPAPAFQADESPEQSHLADTYSIPANLAGLPSVSLPNGLCLTAGISSGKALLRLGQQLMSYPVSQL